MSFETKNKINLVKSKRFWIMLPIFLIMAGWIITGYIYPIIQGQIAVTKINNFIDSSNYDKTQSSIKDLLDYISAHGSEKLKAAVLTTDADGNTTWSIDWIRFAALAVTGNDNKITYVMHAYYPVEEFVVFNSSYFTTLSNIFIAVLFGISTFKPEWEGKKGILSSKIMIVAATYITITFLIYNFAIFPAGVAAKGWASVYPNLYTGFSNSFMHIFNPIAFVVYQCLFAKQNINVENIKKENTKLLLVEIYVLLGYAAYVVIRGSIKAASGNPVNDPKAWPYFFTEVLYNKSLLGTFPGSGLLLFLVFICIILGIVFGFGTMYMTIIKNRQIKGKYNSIDAKEAKTEASVETK